MKIYRGSTSTGTEKAHIVEVYETTGRGQRVDASDVVVHGVEVELVGLLQHVPKHSPSGFAWGYAGSGPADLARSLLIDHFGDDGVCSGCLGSGHQIWDGEKFVPYNNEPTTSMSDAIRDTIGWCVECGGEKTTVSPGLYQAFKSEFVARWPEDRAWEITSEEIDAWLATQPANA